MSFLEFVVVIPVEPLQHINLDSFLLAVSLECVENGQHEFHFSFILLHEQIQPVL